MSTDIKKPSGILHWLDENFENIFLVSGLLAIIFFITWQVVYRYFITPFIDRAGAAVWTEEISRYIFIWISYIAVGVAIRKRSSIRIDFVYQMLPARLQRISWIFVELIFLALTFTIAYYGWGQIERLQRFPQHTAAMRIPFLIPYLILPLGFGLMSLRLLQSMIKQIRVTGILDSLLGAVAAAAVIAPCVLAEYIDPVPALFGYFLVFCVTGVPIAIENRHVCSDHHPLRRYAAHRVSCSGIVHFSGQLSHHGHPVFHRRRRIHGSGRAFPASPQPG